MAIDGIIGIMHNWGNKNLKFEILSSLLTQIQRYCHYR